jgi:hypothetical protein
MATDIREPDWAWPPKHEPTPVQEPDILVNGKHVGTGMTGMLAALKEMLNK